MDDKYDCVIHQREKVKMPDSRDLINSILLHKVSGRIGLHDFWWSDTLKKWASLEKYPIDAVGSPIESSLHFGHDMYAASGSFDVLPLRNVEEVLEETSEWVIKRNGAGASLKWWKNKSGTPEHIDFRMTNRTIWERDYRPHLTDVDRTRVDCKEAAKRLQIARDNNLWAWYGHLFVWENMRQSMGDFCLYESLLLDPDWIHDYCRVYTDFFKAHYKVLFEEAGLPDGIWVFEDLGYKNGTFCAPDVLKRLIFPYYKELVDFFHCYKLPVILHSCGNISEILPLIVDAGFDALNPMEVKAGCDIMAFAQKYGDKLAFIGGFDVRIMESNDIDYIRTHLSEFFQKIKHLTNGYIFGSDHSISPAINYETYKFIMDIYSRNMNY
jgi:uroporphyrinogen decarboxylase